ncbi:MAG: hypothetical protein M3037_00990 [Gemmatimonadota bacterium]|nr:hypothetical protein [Gemmatimonadota bacterium]
MLTTKASRLAALGLTLAILVAERAPGQLPTQPVQSEVRADGIFARSSGVEAGYGVSIPAGIYVRMGLVGGVGAGRHGAESRADLISRFSLDPFRQSRWAPYAGAGLSGRFRPTADGGASAFLLAFLGLEGPVPIGRPSGWVPAVEVGLGGGARVAVILRRGISGRR